MNNSHQNLLVVDDEFKLRELLQSYLTKEGFNVLSVEDGIEMDAALSNNPIDLVILDLMLPGEDGLSLGRRLQQKNIPFIILSARSEELDKIVGLEMGADDYLSKPFNPRELLARIRLVLRRFYSHQQQTETAQAEMMSFVPYLLDIKKYQLKKDGHDIALTSGEFTLLKTFLENPNQVLNRDMLLEKTKGYDHNPLDRSIDICVGRLRKKIEDNPAEPIFLRTIWGAGYIFTLKSTEK